MFLQHTDCLLRCSSLVLAVPHSLPRYFFQSLQTTNIKVIPLFVLYDLRNGLFIKSDFLFRCHPANNNTYSYLTKHHNTNLFFHLTHAQITNLSHHPIASAAAELSETVRFKSRPAGHAGRILIIMHQLWKLLKNKD